MTIPGNGDKDLMTNCLTYNLVQIHKLNEFGWLIVRVGKLESCWGIIKKEVNE